MKVLVVDDDPITLEAIEASLEKWGYQALCLQTAEEAWECFQKPDAPQILIIDWVLPAMSGIELCKLIKDKNNLQFCYIIMLTGRMCSDDVVVGLESGADDYIVKPVDPTELRARLLAGKRILNKFDELKQTNPNIITKPETINVHKRLNFSAPKILIAEDDPVSREVLKENLNQWGFRVIVTTNGEEALTAFRECDGPFLAIIDWMMPRLTGIEVCSQIKWEAEEGMCYLILLTAKSQRSDVAEGLESGADDYLCKPFNAAELRARINVGIRALSTNRHLKAIISHNSEGIVTITGDGTIDSFNPAAERMFAYQAEDILGDSISKLIVEADRENYQNYLNTIAFGISQQDEKPIELTGLRQDQSSFPLELNIACMDYDTNNRFVSIIRDISHQKSTEQKLIQAKETAETANKAKSQFLSSMSHELRTPLNAILGFAQLLELDSEEEFSNDQRESLECILQGGHHLLGLINEILDLAKIESGKVSMQISTVNMNKVLKESIALIIQLANSNQVEIFQTATTELNQIQGDQERLRQVILNLLSNAIKYNSRPGKIFIEKSQPQQGRLRIAIRDTGQGIPKDKQSQVFKPFSRLGAEISDIEGTGIGLVITKTLIEEMGGAIGFESDLGKGSLFWIELPIAEDKPQS